jgi:hypothetical protein
VCSLAAQAPPHAPCEFVIEGDAASTMRHLVPALITGHRITFDDDVGTVQVSSHKSNIILLINGNVTCTACFPFNPMLVSGLPKSQPFV